MWSSVSEGVLNYLEKMEHATQKENDLTKAFSYIHQLSGMSESLYAIVKPWAEDISCQ